MTYSVTLKLINMISKNTFSILFWINRTKENIPLLRILDSIRNIKEIPGNTVDESINNIQSRDLNCRFTKSTKMENGMNLIITIYIINTSNSKSIGKTLA